MRLGKVYVAYIARGIPNDQLRFGNCKFVIRFLLLLTRHAIDKRIRPCLKRHHVGLARWGEETQCPPSRFEEGKLEGHDTLRWYRMNRDGHSANVALDQQLRYQPANGVSDQNGRLREFLRLYGKVVHQVGQPIGGDVPVRLSIS